MKKIVLLLFIFAFGKALSQTQKGIQLSTEAVIKQYKILSNKAVWFQEMPHFNSDSTAFYFGKAIRLLQLNTPIQNDLLVCTYLKQSKLFSSNITINAADSISAIALNYFKKIKNKSLYFNLEYDLLQNWAAIKLELGEQKKQSNYFLKHFWYLKKTKLTLNLKQKRNPPQN